MNNETNRDLTGRLFTTYAGTMLFLILGEIDKHMYLILRFNYKENGVCEVEQFPVFKDIFLNGSYPEVK